MTPAEALAGAIAGATGDTFHPSELADILAALEAAGFALVPKGETWNAAVEACATIADQQDWADQTHRSAMAKEITGRIRALMLAARPR